MKPSKTPSNTDADPNRATILEILRELNKSEESAQDPNENGLESDEITERLFEFWAVKEGKVRLNVLIGTLLQNGMVEHLNKGTYSWVRKRNTQDRFRITSDGKEFLRSSIVASDRVS